MKVAAGMRQPETARGNSGQPATMRRALTVAVDFKVHRTRAHHGWAGDSEVRVSANRFLDIEDSSQCLGRQMRAVSTLRIELSHEPTQRG
jgi:hypothetical protein